MYSRFFYMFHDAAYNGFMSVAYAVYVNFQSVFQELVYKNRMLLRYYESFLGEFFKGFVVINYFHCPAAQDIRRPDKRRIAYPAYYYPGFLERISSAIFRPVYIKLGKYLVEFLAVFGYVDGHRRSS